MNFVTQKDVLDILVLFGGISSEHEVSRLSAASVISHMDENKYKIHKIGITKNGNWFYTEATTDEIEDGTWENLEDNKRVNVNLSHNRGIYILDSNEEKYLKIDCCFPILHGKQGEDGIIQSLLELLNIKYISSKPMSSAISMDKAMTKLILSTETEIRQAKYYILRNQDFIKNPLETLDEINNYFEGKFPLYIKPANGGSSIGISKASNMEESFEGIKEAFKYDNKIVIEEGICGREIEVAVLGNKDIYTTRPGEILTNNQMYDYELKYHSTNELTKIVDDIDEEKIKEFQDKAKKIYKVLDCKSLSRVDFFYTEDGEIVFNEINTIPGFTKNSMYPKLWQDFGFSYGELIDKLIELSMEEI